jgi:uncharacterized membrane protein
MYGLDTKIIAFFMLAHNLISFCFWKTLLTSLSVSIMVKNKDKHVQNLSFQSDNVGEV